MLECSGIVSGDLAVCGSWTLTNVHCRPAYKCSIPGHSKENTMTRNGGGMLEGFGVCFVSGSSVKIGNLKVGLHNVFPKVTFPPWRHPVKIWRHTVSG